MDIDDPLYPAAAQFPLGRPFGLLAPSDPEAGPELVPFGLRQAVETPAAPIGDPASYGYDHDRQVGVVFDGERLLPLLKHTTGKTNTVTHPDGAVPRDSDDDYRED